MDKKSKRHGGELVAEVLQSHGVHYIFTLPGGHISPIVVAAEKLGIRIVDTRHEVRLILYLCTITFVFKGKLKYYGLLVFM